MVGALFLFLFFILLTLDATERGSAYVKGPIDYTHNAVDHGLVVSGDNVHGYGMAVEHTLKDLTVWSGEVNI